MLQTVTYVQSVRIAKRKWHRKLLNQTREISLVTLTKHRSTAFRLRLDLGLHQSEAEKRFMSRIPVRYNETEQQLVIYQD